MSEFIWELGVRRLNEYGDKVVSETPATVIAPTQEKAAEKAGIAFGAKYDSFRKFWSHYAVVKSMREVAAVDAERAEREGKS